MRPTRLKRTMCPVRIFIDSSSVQCLSAKVYRLWRVYLHLSLPLYGHTMQSSRKFSKILKCSCNIPSKTAMAVTCLPKAMMTYEESATTYAEYTLILACPHTVMPCISSSKFIATFQNTVYFSRNIPWKVVMAITCPSSYDYEERAERWYWSSQLSG